MRGGLLGLGIRMGWRFGGCGDREWVGLIKSGMDRLSRI